MSKLRNAIFAAAMAITTSCTQTPEQIDGQNSGTIKGKNGNTAVFHKSMRTGMATLALGSEENPKEFYAEYPTDIKSSWTKEAAENYIKDGTFPELGRVNLCKNGSYEGKVKSDSLSEISVLLKKDGKVTLRKSNWRERGEDPLEVENLWKAQETAAEHCNKALEFIPPSQ